MGHHEHLEGIVKLRLDAEARHRLYVGKPGAEKDMREHVSKALADAARSGESLVFAPNGRVRAHFTSWHENKAWYGSPADFCIVDHQLGDHEAEAWLIDRIHERAPTFTPNFDLTLDSSYRNLFAKLTSLGLGIDSVILVGDTAAACSALPDPGPRLEKLGLTVRDLEEADIDAVVELEKVVNSETPQFCWFGASEAYLEQERERLCHHREDGSIDIRNVIVDATNKIVGYFGASVEDTPNWGRCGGMVFVLTRQLQGKGLARALYSIVLQQMLERNVVRFKGGTSQPGVMKLAKLMNREPTAWVFRRSTPFPASHFEGFVPGAVS